MPFPRHPCSFSSGRPPRIRRIAPAYCSLVTWYLAYLLWVTQYYYHFHFQRAMLLSGFPYGLPVGYPVGFSACHPMRHFSCNCLHIFCACQFLPPDVGCTGCPLRRFQIWPTPLVDPIPTLNPKQTHRFLVACGLAGAVNIASGCMRLPARLTWRTSL